MKLAIMQPYLFPYIGYFQLINSVDKFVVLDDVNFITRGWINRNRIVVNGKEHLFSIPIKKASQNKMIFECEIADSGWKSKLLKTIEYSYKKAPYFKETYNTISSIIYFRETNLSAWLTNQIKSLCDLLGIDTIIINTSKVYNNSQLKAQDKIIDICLKENATDYYNAIGGMDLYGRKDFEMNNINLQFLKALPEKYRQEKDEFIPFLSIIDIMMYNSKSEIKNLLNKYELL